ncbi:MAG: ATP-binding protein [Myxococcota bacterium]|nr:ATP-binding protein [Myxococcota bacterium]
MSLDVQSDTMAWSPLLELIPGGVVLISADGVTLHINPTARQVFDEYPDARTLALEGGGLLHAAALRICVQSVGENRLVTMESAPLPARTDLAIVMSTTTQILRSEGLLRELVTTGTPLVDVLDEADQEDLTAVLKAGGGRLELVLSSQTLDCEIEHVPELGGWTLIGSDRTLERSLQNMLREGERRFLRLIEGIPVALLISDTDGCSAYANVLADTLLGGNSLHQGTPLKAIMEAAQMRVVGEGTPYPHEQLPMFRAQVGERCSVDDVEMFLDGRWSSLEISSAPVVGLSGEIIYAITIIKDINDRQELQNRLQRVQRMEAAGQLAGELAHDFNNFLTAISSYSQLTLGALTLDHPARSDVEEVIQVTHQAATLTRQLLTISRRQPMSVNQLSFVGILERLERLIRRLLGEQVSLEIDLGRGVWPVMADSGLLERVIINLALNARDAMANASGARLRISLENVVLDAEAAAALVDVQPGAYVMAVFADNGIGIPSEVLDRIFEPFFTTKPEGLGTGLGLSMVYGVIRQSGGFLSVDSTPGHGASFRIALPRADAPPPSDRPGSVPDVSGRLLLVEDEERIRYTTARMLTRQGYSVQTAATPLEALALIRADADRFDLVITDVHLPQMRGDVLIQEILKIRADLSVLFISGSLIEERLLGRNILTKPFTTQELSGAIAKLMSERQ